jgi:hypothetical protein
MLLGAGVGVAIAVSGPRLEPPPPTARPHTGTIQPVPAPPPSGSLMVKSTPAGARVLVEKRERCRTPCRVEGLSTVSTTVIRIELDGYLPWSSLVDLGKGQPERIAKLRERPSDLSKWGALLIRANAPADVLVGGAPIGHVTTEGPLELPSGETTLTLVGAGGAKVDTKVNVKAGETVSVDVSLK